MKSLLFSLLWVCVFSLQNLNAQSPANEGYHYINVVSLLTDTYNYRDQIEAKDGAQAYQKTEKCYFEATYKGKRRKVMNSLFLTPNQPAIATLAYISSNPTQPREEVLMEVEGEKIWMPLNPACEQNFLEELKAGQKAQILATFIVEHTAARKLNTAFVIDAFFK